MGSIAYRDFRREADDIDETPIEDVKIEEREKFRREMADPAILDLLMGPRHVIDGKIQPYHEHPDYLEHLKKQEDQKVVEKQKDSVQKTDTEMMKLRARGIT